MIKVLFDHQKFTTQRYGGISRYFANIIQQINHSPEFSCEVGFLYSRNHYLKNEQTATDRVMERLLKSQFIDRKLFQLNESYCKYLVGKNNFDIFHPTYYDPYFLGSLKKPLVTTIHDMTYEKLPEYFWVHDYLTHNKRLHIERADAIIAISETTKSDLLKYHDVDESKVSVIYHGIDSAPLIFKPVDGLPKNYLLYVGDRSGYKNFYLFMDAFKKLSARYPDLNVVLTGGGPLGIADRELLYRLKLTDRVKHVNVTDEQLNYLYQNTILFVYPSLHEGFGLPILEAFKAQCPILLSNTPCFKEIARDAVAYFEAHLMEDLADKIEMFLTDSTKRETFIAKGSKRLADFPLDVSIHQTLDLYKSLV
ncbi:D-inositol-3-phosphate glycosyltransferase [Dyadobacter sp. CECT 9275]|uniref:D-inositol-3-phosphate glycosyltransferase n=1 Tax=Dyadobacter helix TaxID=2822344 RepID=A0A916N5M3_9BACT|nr:glycosyltransferase family 1 protein [Dyadobacter sp. CECT 9275]CAG4998956.1 D-inositol-3-phosphate glycosyltransferase [Dyadobacter sp. CECT 9275]